MKNRKSSVTALTALLLAALTATPALAQGNAAPVPPSTRAQGGRTLGNTRSAAPQLTLRYYSADPLKGGRSLTTRSVTPDGLRAALGNPPQGARYAVLGGGRETRIIDLSDSAGLTDAGRLGGGRRGGGDRGPDGRGPAPFQDQAAQGQAAQGQAAQGQAAQDQADQESSGPAGTGRGGADHAGPGQSGFGRGGPAEMGGLLTQGGTVAFYAADPLGGGRPLKTVTLKAGEGMRAALAQLQGNGYRYALVTSGRQRVIIDLTRLDGAGRDGPGRDAATPAARAGK